MLQNLYIGKKSTLTLTVIVDFLKKEIPTFHRSLQAWRGKGVLFQAEMPTTAGVSNTNSNPWGGWNWQFSSSYVGNWTRIHHLLHRGTFGCTFKSQDPRILQKYPPPSLLDGNFSMSSSWKRVLFSDLIVPVILCISGHIFSLLFTSRMKE